MAGQSNDHREIARPIQLTFDSEERVEVFARDRHRFLTTAAEAAAACKAAIDISLWVGEFKELLAHLNKWCSARNQVDGCYVSVGEGGLHVFLLMRSEEYQFEFQTEIAALELSLSDVFPDHPADVIQIPRDNPDAIESFFSPDHAIQAYGDAATAPS